MHVRVSCLWGEKFRFGHQNKNAMVDMGSPTLYLGSAFWELTITVYKKPFTCIWNALINYNSLHCILLLKYTVWWFLLHSLMKPLNWIQQTNQINYVTIFALCFIVVLFPTLLAFNHCTMWGSDWLHAHQCSQLLQAGLNNRSKHRAANLSRTDYLVCTIIKNTTFWCYCRENIIPFSFLFSAWQSLCYPRAFWPQHIVTQGSGTQTF